MNAKNVILEMAIAAVVLVAAVGSASAIDIDSCGVTADVLGGYYELTGDLTCNADETCIIIGANGVTIDGKGHNITGNRSTSNCFISIVPYETTSQTIPANHSAILNKYFYEDVTIKDLEIKEFCSGIALKGSDVNNNTITDCSIHDCGVSTGVTHGIHMVHTNNCTICRNEIYNIEGSGHSGGCSGGGNGIFMFGEVTSERGWYNTLTCNYLHNNDKSGFFMKHQCMYNTISHNNATCNAEGGIVPMCSMSDHNHYEYNNMSGNTIWGFMSAGNHNTIRWNTANNNQIGIFLGSAGMGPGDWNNITNNTACGNSDMDIKANDIANNAAGSNTCNTSNLGGCDWSCGANNLVPVYYDFDEDTYYSKDPADCSCGIVGDGQCACCNPGLFNGSDEAKASYEASCNCQWTSGVDPNDCLVYTATGDLFESDGTTPLMGAVVTMKNRKTGGGPWNAAVVGNTYTVKVDPVLDISAGDMLRITANNGTADGVTDHKVHTCDIAAEGFTANVIIENYILNYYPCYPYYTQKEANWSGPAVMQACIGHYYDIEDVPTQAALNDTGIGYNQQDCNADLEYVDPLGMWKTLNYDWMWSIGRNYGLYVRDNTTAGLNSMLHYTCYWQHLGPAPIPAYGNYSNWMAVRGIRTSEDPYPQSAGNYDIYGFWINDPNDGPESIGENSYKTVDEWTSTYYHNLSGVKDCDDYKYKYVGLFEPPEQPEPEVTLVHARPMFDGAITPVLAEEPMMMYGVKQLALEKVVKDDELLKIVKAAIDGVNEELVPYDSEFAAVFAKTVPGQPKLVSSYNGDYYVVPFNVPVEVRLPVKKMPVELERPKISGLKKLERVKRVADKIELKPIPIEPIKAEKTLVVVIVDAEDGSFKEASWVENPVKYLPVSKVEAMKLVLGEVLDELRIVARKDARDLEVIQQKPTIELVYRDASPYYPDWKVTVDGKVFYVSQDGTVSCDEPEEPKPTPTLTSRPIKPGPIRILPI